MSPPSPSCKSPLSPLSPGGGKKKVRVHRLRPLPLYTEQPTEGEVALPSQPSDFACLNMAAGAAAAARRARSPQVTQPPSYETLYSPNAISTPIYSALEERVEFLLDLPKTTRKVPECATCQAGVSCPIHPYTTHRDLYTTRFI